MPSWLISLSERKDGGSLSVINLQEKEDEEKQRFMNQFKWLRVDFRSAIAYAG